jgi:acyl-CoA synthetase (AMP-forming)/AMP-acid ligase II
VIQTHGNVNAVIKHLNSLYQFNQSDRNLAIAPLTHGGSHYILPILAAGGCHLLMPTADVNAITHALKEQRASISFMPPTLIYKLLDETDISEDDCPHLRHITYSAAPMPPERIQQFQQRLGPKLSTLYGQTEAPMTITAMSAADLTKPELIRSVGKACADSEIAILDENLHPLPCNQTGQIAVRGAIVTPAYFNAPHQTRDAFHNDWLLTGDLGELNENGYLFLKGRAKEMIISGGFNVYPAEVENIMSQHPAISECVVVGIADDYWGERVEAAICTHPGQSVDTEQLLNDIKEQLGAVKTPKQLHHFSSLPRNPVGKVVRRDILELIQQQA